MKNVLLIFSLFCFLTLDSWANIQAQLSYSTFYSPSSGPYIEIYLYFNGEKVSYKKGDSGYYSEISVDYQFLVEGKLKKDASFIVNSPIVGDTVHALPNFLIQHRISLSNGEYDMKVILKDMNSDNPELETVERVKLNYNEELLTLSDIELTQSAEPSTESGMFQKSGFMILPYTSEIIPGDLSQIGFYTELYNADKVIGLDSAFLITYYVEEYDGGKLVSNFRGFSRKKASRVNVIIGKFMVGDLPGGNYNIKIDVINKQNQLLASKSIAFHKESQAETSGESDLSGSFVDRYQSIDSLSLHIDYLQPIADRLEWEFAENQLEAQNFDLMKKFFLNFWQVRNQADPEREWYEYLKQVKIVNENFNSRIRPGYQSDRGIKYLKYGPPEERYESFDEPHAYPYEIWYYHQVNNQTNKRIVFYNPSLVLNDYVLLHSDIFGEIYNKDWNLILHRMSPGYYEGETPRVPDAFGDKTDDFMRGK
ncbi:MAG TPA: hypothetical protein DCX54_04885 [Flavobacteriales bacterium]|nr:hypothetical protein [Flavobacteriales bacterium]